MENAEIFGVIEATESIWARLIAYFFETNEDAKVSNDAHARQRLLYGSHAAICTNIATSTFLV